MILTVILAVLLLMNLILLSIHYQYHRRLSGTFEEGFATDLGRYPKRHLIPKSYTLTCFIIKE